MNQKSVGLIVNPIAGMGGKVGLKGTDSEDAVSRAKALGAVPVSPARAVKALKVLHRECPSVDILAVSSEMGELEAKEAGFAPIVVRKIQEGKTTSEDTKVAARLLTERAVNLILFVGGDGTAKDILHAINGESPVLGVPAGVKIYSAVFATDPIEAGRLASKFLQESLALREGEVVDINEEDFRADKLTLSLLGYLRVPFDPTFMQNLKMPTLANGDEEQLQHEIAHHIVEEMDSETVYVLGPGTTAKAIKSTLSVDHSLLGVDLVRGGRLIGKDVSEAQILQAIEGRQVKVIVTPIGGQGFLFGRGNQQISPRVLRLVGKENVIVVATETKLKLLRPRRLLVDTGDIELDAKLRGHVKVVSGYRKFTVLEVA